MTEGYSSWQCRTRNVRELRRKTEVRFRNVIYVWKLSFIYSSVMINCSYALDYDVREFSFLTLFISWRLRLPCEGLRKILWIQSILTKVPLCIIFYIFVCLFAPSIILFLPIHGIAAQNISWMITSVSRAYCVHNFKTSAFSFNVVPRQTFNEFNVRIMHIRRSRNNQHYTLICTTPLFYILAPTCFGSSLSSSGSFVSPSELLEIQIEWVVYHIMCGYVACVPECCGSVCCASQLSAYHFQWISKDKTLCVKRYDSQYTGAYLTWLKRMSYSCLIYLIKYM
jgi:hypothetical protein